jgi:hypothetical protein
MIDFGSAATLGLILGFFWGIFCSLALLYVIFLRGYQKAVEDSLVHNKSRRWRETLDKVQKRRQRSAGAAAAARRVPPQ